MNGTNSFGVYSNTAGTNVTLSPRLDVGEGEPLSGSTAVIALLDGPGASDGMMVHAVLMALAFALILPLGATVIRLFSFKNLIWVTGISRSLDHSHHGVALYAIFGIVVTGALLHQPIIAVVTIYQYTLLWNGVRLSTGCGFTAMVQTSDMVLELLSSGVNGCRSFWSLS
jgi:hypothetical protein